MVMRAQTRVGRRVTAGSRGPGRTSFPLPRGAGPVGAVLEKSDGFSVQPPRVPRSQAGRAGTVGAGWGSFICIFRSPASRSSPRRSKGINKSRHPLRRSPSPHPFLPRASPTLNASVAKTNKIKQNLLLWQPLSHVMPLSAKEDFFLLPLSAFFLLPGLPPRPPFPVLLGPLSFPQIARNLRRAAAAGARGPGGRAGASLGRPGLAGIDQLGARAE